MAEIWTLEEIETGLWLDASDTSTLTISDADKLDQINDKSGFSRHATSTGTSRPTVADGALVFDGSDDRLLAPNVYSLETIPIYIAIAYKPTVSGVYKGLVDKWVSSNGWMIHMGDASNLGRPTMLVNGFSLISPAPSVSGSGAITEAQISLAGFIGGPSGQTEEGYDSLRMNDEYFTIGGDGVSTFALAMNFLELVVTHYEPTATQRELIQGYLAWKSDLTSGTDEYTDVLLEGHAFKEGAPYVVPDVEGTLASDAVLNIESGDYEPTLIASVTYEASETVPPGYVISQDVAAGEVLAGGGTVNLVVSALVLPLVEGETEAAAIATLEGEGYTVTTQTTLSTLANKDIVLAQADPDESDNILLTIGDGLGALVPDVDDGDKTEAQAIAAIEAAGFVASSRGSYSTGTIGNVFRQSPAAGTLLATGSTVQILYTSTNTPPAEITSWTELNAIRLALAGDYVLGRSLLKTDPDYTGIGNVWVMMPGNFSGSFDLSGFTIEGTSNTVATSTANQGIFVSQLTGIIRNGILKDFFGVRTGGGTSFGGICGTNSGIIENIKMQDCYVRASGGFSEVGGFCAFNQGRITECRFIGGELINDSTVNGVGAFGRTGNLGFVERSFVDGTTITSYNNCGAFSGTVTPRSPLTPSIIDCYANNVTLVLLGSTGNGLFSGATSNGTPLTKNCWANVTATGAGSFDKAFAGTGERCYYDSTTSGYSAQNVAGQVEPKTTAEMKTLSTFVDWDFDTTWFLESGEYPDLRVFYVEVPLVEGETEAAATATLEGLGLVVATTEEYSETVAAGLVISQDPAAETLVDPGSTVNLVISLGPEEAEVPSIAGLTATQADAVIVANGFTPPASPSYAMSSTVLAGRVMAQTPAAGTMYTLGETIDYTLSLGSVIYITTYEDLKKIGTQADWPLDGDYEVLNNIDCSASITEGGFSPIGGFISGSSSITTVPFTGTITGGNYTFTNLKLKQISKDLVVS